MSKIVKAAAVVLNVGGASQYLYRGAPIPTGADAEDVKRLVGLGLIVDGATVEGERAVDNALAEPSTAWTADQLREFAESKQIDLGKARSKADLVAAIKEAKPITVVEPATLAPANPATPAEPAAVVADDSGTVVVDGETGTTPVSE